MAPTSSVSTRLLKHLRHLAGERHPHRSPAALRYAEHYLTKAFREAGCHVKAHAFRALGSTYHNVLASTAPASTSAASAAPLVIGAHYDTYEGSPGADDNASALAVLLETAHAMKGLPASRPIVFVGFCLEEFNLLGSRAYAAALRKRGQPVHGAIILECVGYADERDGTQQQPPIPITLPNMGDFLGIVGNESAKELVTVFERAASQGPSPLKTISMIVPGNGDAFPDTRRSDHAAFWDYGFPAVMLTDTANFRNPHYHQPTDTLDTLNLPFLERVTGLVVRVVQRLAQ